MANDDLNIKEIIAAWLEACLEVSDPCVLHSHHFQTNLVSWAKNEFGRLHNASSYQRKWRELRRRPRELQQRGISFRETPTHKSEKAWLIKSTSQPVTSKSRRVQRGSGAAA